MKKIIVIVVLAALGYVGYTKWQEWKKSNTSTGTESPANTVVQQSTPTPTPQRNLTPDGTYILLERVSVTTDAGVNGIAAGTKVKEVSITATGMLVTDGKNQFEITPAQATNDLDRAARSIPGFSKAAFAATPNPHPHIAPEGTYFLLETISVTTDSSIVGISAGTKVTFVSATPKGMMVTDGTTQFEVNASQVTNDMDAAKQALKADAAAQARLAGFIQQQQTLAAQQRLAQASATPSSSSTPTPAIVATPAPALNSLESGAYNSTKDKVYTDPSGRHYWVDALGRRHYQ